MLKSLYILNYALISELSIDFGPGFSTITGETGAGKSIIMGALSLIFGQRADMKSLKTDADKCIIEAEFDLSPYSRLKSFFTDNDIDLPDNDCIIRRELTASGKSRAFINDTPVSLNLLRDLTTQLVDIHSQHDNLLLYNPTYQLDVVDAVAGNAELLRAYEVRFNEWQQLKAALKKMQDDARKMAADQDYLMFQYNQLSDANLQPGEQEELEQEQETLAHAEDIKRELLYSQQLLDEDEKSALPLLKEVIVAVGKIKGYVPEAGEWSERLQSGYIELKDILTAMTRFADRVEDNPGRLEQIATRLSELYTLQKKYKVTDVNELIALRDQFELQLQKIDSSEEDIEQLKIAIDNAYTDMCLQSGILTESRKNVLEYIENFLVKRLSELGMPNIRFKIQLDITEDYSAKGQNEVQFLFSANKNREIQPVRLIASGGEISRLMLSVKALIADKSELPTIVFDEIDTGVSGEIASRMGDIMAEMGKSMQVLTITHLPQIAAKSRTQYRVYKDESKDQTQTYIEQLTEQNRITEIAQMLSGKQYSEIAILNAKELLGM